MSNRQKSCLFIISCGLITGALISLVWDITHWQFYAIVIPCSIIWVIIDPWKNE